MKYIEILVFIPSFPSLSSSAPSWISLNHPVLHPYLGPLSLPIPKSGCRLRQAQLSPLHNISHAHMDNLKGVSDPEMVESVVRQHSDLHEFKESEGYIAKIDTEHRGHLKTAKDGHTVLIPQPSEDPQDPLNWSPVKKHVILFIISFAAFLPDYGSATGAVTLIPQAAYGISVIAI
jgi:hypothetical protein